MESTFEMRYAKSIPKTDSLVGSHYLAQGWRKLKEPPSLLSTVIVSIPFMFLCFILNLFLLWKMNPALFEFTRNSTIQITFKWMHILFFIIGLYAYIFLHEMILFVFLPVFSISENILWGFRPGFVLVYLATPLSRWRFALICLFLYIFSVSYTSLTLPTKT